MSTLKQSITFALTLISLSIFLSCSSNSSSPKETKGDCNGLATLTDGGSQLTLANEEHTPTVLEKKATAFLWGIAVLIQEDQAIDPFLLEQPFNELLAATPVEYPSLFPSSTTCTITQALVSTPADFACGNSCVPSPLLLERTGKAILD